MNNHLNRNVYLLNMLGFLNNAMFIVPIVVLYLEAQKGVGFTGFLMGESLFSLVMIFMEIPSGYLSDVWRRKQVLAIAMVWKTIGLCVLFFGSGFAMVLFAQCLIGVGASLNSGTNSALLYDTLLSQGREKLFSKLNGRRLMFGMIGSSSTALVGGYLYTLHPEFPVLISIVSLILAVLICVFMVEPERHKETVQKNPLADMLSVMKYTLHGHKELACLIAFITSIFVTCNLMLWVQQRYWIESSISEIWFGVLMAIGVGFNAVGAFFAHKLEEYLRFIHIVSLMAALPFIFYGLSIVLPYSAGIYTLMLGGFAWGIGQPLMDSAINHRVGSSRRATVLSVKSLVHRFAFIPLTLLAGPLADMYNAKVAMTGLLTLMVVGVLLSVLCMKHHHMLSDK